MIQRASLQTSDVSLIIPARNAAATLGRCLEAIAQGRDQPFEVIVVDDGSSDETSAIAERHGARLLRSEVCRGPAAARNLGAAAARGTILFFVDADVLVHRDTLGPIVRALSGDDDVVAVFGSYDGTPGHPGLFSRFKNLQHHFVHQRSKTEAATFWTACGAIRKEAFDAVGGFDDRWWTIQDIELGMRLRSAGQQIRLDHELQVTHLKSYTFTSWLRSDLLSRAIPWSLLILARRAMPSDLNLRWSDRLSGVLAISIPVLVAIPLPWLSRILLCATALVSIGLINRPLLTLLWRVGDRRLALLALPLLALHYATATLAFAAAVFLHAIGKRERPFWWPLPAPAGTPTEFAPSPAPGARRTSAAADRSDRSRLLARD